MIKLLLFVIFVKATTGTNFHLHECSGIPLPKDYSIEECPKGAPCHFYDGQTINPKTTINLDKSVTSLSKITALIGPNGEVIYEHVSGTVCDHIDGGCPLEAGEHTIKETFQAKGQPNVPYTIVQTIRDQDDNAVACFSFLDKFISK